jgi:hypothetical protein
MRTMDVRETVAHMLGMAEAQASMLQFVHDFRAASKRSGGAMIDAMTATQDRERAELTPAQLDDCVAAVAPHAVRARRRPGRKLAPSDAARSCSGRTDVPTLE